MGVENLDSRINEYSYKMVEKLKEGRVSFSEIDKALGVLGNDGVYGYYVYCKSKTGGKSEREKIKSPIFSEFVVNIIKNFKDVVDMKLDKPKDKFEEYDEYFSELSKDIHKLLFFKDILEKILIYARYHAKAVGDENV